MLLLLSCWRLLPGDEVVPDREPDMGCDDMAVAAVLLTVGDTTGETIEATTASWRLAGGDWQQMDCRDEPCTEWAGAWEVSGDLEVRATLTGEVPEAPCCDYAAESTERVTVELDSWGCHPVPVEVRLQLDTDEQVCLDTGCQ